MDTLKYFRREFLLSIKPTIIISILVLVFMSIFGFTLSLDDISAVFITLGLIGIFYFVIFVFLLHLIIKSIYARLFSPQAYLTYTLPLKTSSIVLGTMLNVLSIILIISISTVLGFAILSLSSRIDSLELLSNVISFLSKNYLMTFIQFVDFVVYVIYFIALTLFVLTISHLTHKPFSFFRGILTYAILVSVLLIIELLCASFINFPFLGLTSEGYIEFFTCNSNDMIELWTYEMTFSIFTFTRNIILIILFTYFAIKLIDKKIDLLY